MKWTSLNFILIFSWQHFCRLVTDSYFKNDAISIRYTLENILVAVGTFFMKFPVAALRFNKAKKDIAFIYRGFREKGTLSYLCALGIDR